MEFFLEKTYKNFQDYYKIGNNITIDDSLLSFTCRNNMKLYIPMKPQNVDLKFIYFKS